jgi:hypothetical protein
MAVVTVILFVAVLYVGALIVRDIYWDIATRPPKKANKDQYKILTRKINTTKERIQ